MIISVFQLGTTDLQQFLIAITSSGLIGIIISWFTEQIPLWRAAPSWAPLWIKTNWSGFKRWLMFAVTVALPFLVALAMGNSPEFVSQSPFWQGLVVQGLVVWLGSQFGHSVNPNRVKPYVSLLLGLLTKQNPNTFDWHKAIELIESLEAKDKAG